MPRMKIVARIECGIAQILIGDADADNCSQIDIGADELHQFIAILQDIEAKLRAARET